MRRRDFVSRRISHRMAACVRAQQVEGVRQIGVLMGYSDGERQVLSPSQWTVWYTLSRSARQARLNGRSRSG
jgi:hypothetical protein